MVLLFIFSSMFVLLLRMLMTSLHHLSTFKISLRLIIHSHNSCFVNAWIDCLIYLCFNLSFCIFLLVLVALILADCNVTLIFFYVKSARFLPKLNVAVPKFPVALHIIFILFILHTSFYCSSAGMLCMHNIFMR